MINSPTLAVPVTSFGLRWRTRADPPTVISQFPAQWLGSAARTCRLFYQWMAGSTTVNTARLPSSVRGAARRIVAVSRPMTTVR